MKKIILLCVLVLALVGCAQEESIGSFFNLENSKFIEMGIAKASITGLTSGTSGTYNGDEVYEFIKTIVPTERRSVSANEDFGSLNYTLIIKTSGVTYAIAIGDDYLSINPQNNNPEISSEIIYHAIDPETMLELEAVLSTIMKYFRI